MQPRFPHSLRTTLVTCRKELLLLSRDRSGLALLFVMPAVLVLVVALVQNNVMQGMESSAVKVLFLDNDQQGLGDALAERFADAGFVLTRDMDGLDPSLESLKELVGKGRYQCGIVLPENATRAFQARIAAGAGQAPDTDQPSGTLDQFLPVTIYFDPLAQGAFRSAVLAGVRSTLLGYEFEHKSRGLAEFLSVALARGLDARYEPEAADIVHQAMQDIESAWTSPRLFTLQEQSPLARAEAALPNAVQQNVPAWALFGMFFIVLPMAGGLLKERQDGVLGRLLVMPVSVQALMAGKAGAYVLVCLVQFTFIVLMGMLLLPVPGLPELNLGTSPAGVALMALCSALAATGYGLLVGVLVRSYEQVSMVGPVSVVAASALGGIMVPVHAMPPAMQTVSNFSPLAWGLTGFLDIFVRQGNVGTVMPQALLLLGFSLFCMVAARWGLARRGRNLI